MRYTSFTSYDFILLAQGLGVSLALFLATTLIGLFVGTMWAIIRFYRVPVLTQFITFLAELLKNSPVLVQLFLVFFGLPALAKINITPVEAAVITLSGNTAAFIYVIAVSAIESIGRDQIESARVFGLSRWQVLRHVTSLISVIGVVDLTKIGNILNLRTLKPFIVWTVVGGLYYVTAKLIAYGGARLEQRLRAHTAWKGL
jgi:His/Glu/Gln/Arg/opine family amino acid ABC transporter permease subunit